MANPVVELIIRARDEASAAIGKTEKALDSLQSQAGKVGAALGAFGLATAGLVYTFRDFIRASNESEMAQVKLVNALKSTGSATQANIDALNKQADALSIVTGMDDESITRMQAMLAMYKMNAQAIQTLTPLILDLAAAKGLDAQTAGFLVARSMEYGLTILRRYGVAVDAATNKQFMMSDSSHRLAMMTHLLSTQGFKGLAEAMGATFQGRVGAFETQLGNMKELAGDLLKNILTPFIAKLVDMSVWFNHLSMPMRSVATSVGLLGITMAAAIPAAMGLVLAVKMIGGAAILGALSTVLIATGYFLAFGAAALSVGLLVVGFVNAASGAFTALKESVTNVLRDLARIFEAFQLTLEGVYARDPVKVKAGVKAMWSAIKSATLDGAAGVMGALGEVGASFDKTIDSIAGRVTGFLYGGKKTAGGAGGGGGGEGPGSGVQPDTKAADEARQAIYDAWQNDIITYGQYTDQMRMIGDKYNADQKAQLDKWIGQEKATADKMKQLYTQMGNAGAKAASDLIIQEYKKVHDWQDAGRLMEHAMRLAFAEQIKVLANFAASAITIYAAETAWSVMKDMGHKGGVAGWIAGGAVAAGIITAGMAAAAAVSALGGIAAAAMSAPVTSGGASAGAGPSPDYGGVSGGGEAAPGSNGVGGYANDSGGKGTVNITVNVPELTDQQMAQRVAKAVAEEIALQQNSGGAY